MTYLLRLGFGAVLLMSSASLLRASDFEWGRLGSDPMANFATQSENAKESIQRLADWMTGSFSSAAQAEADSTFFDIRLEMVQIWDDRTDGIWLYVEQAASWALDRPYRQRVYHLDEDMSGLIRSTVYSLPDPEAAAGKYRNPAFFNQVRPEELEIRQGCHILLEPVVMPAQAPARLGAQAHPGAQAQAQGSARLPRLYFVGSTEDKLCQSSLRGATYATSEVVIGPDFVESWDRGWDGEDEQVWGAVKAAYIFEKTRDYGFVVSTSD